MTTAKIIREPLVHFILLGALIFGVYSFISGDSWSSNRITITSAKIAQLSEIFVKTWQRPPNAEEVKAMIDDYVKEELYVRQALVLGLDKDDTVIRRRLRQKMEFFSSAEAESVAPTDTELQAYLVAHPHSFEIEPQIALQQVFLNAERHGDSIAGDAAALLATLKAKPETGLSTLGDPTMLPSSLSLTRLTNVAETYGAEVADGARRAPVGQWVGPVRSGYGFHLIRVTERQAGRLPALTEVHDTVQAEWIQAKRHEVEERRLAEWLKRYQVVIETAPNVEGTAP
ncbi:peptidylprolyl isomerase [Mesorhizobium qingshengii]|uniref:Parvulin-like PPIase n=1 Tax=Mesorhizobium qingshengii TaxID=1165689 RepID=A0A1G5ZCS4_9HYPH|nr:peptidylprolyl isomerase [Mesorhizobium qingshengii]SDA92671.1 PPIC-type PPIASE domain-containing protein [Mesorhizobium qingshengii]